MCARVLLALGFLLALALAPGRAQAASEGSGLYVGPAPLPWVESRVTVDVALGLARGEVRQTFFNHTGRVVEAVYVFPLPTGAVVTGMTMDVAGTRIDGVIAPRADAAAGYERAIAGGRAAALTERERPGVYTQSVAGIPAGGQVAVTLRWQARLRRHQGEWELAHPLVVGPRYTPGTATGAPTVGGGTATDTDRAPDASRLTPPRDATASARFVVTATLHDAGAVTSPTHTLALGTGDRAVVASIDDPRGNRELVLRWRHATLGPVRAVAEPTAEGTYVAVLIEPPPAPAPPRRGARSWLIAVDRSASMQGAAAAQSRRLVHAIVASLGAGDRAAVVAVGARPRWEKADAAGRATLDERIDRLPVTGGDLTAGLAVTLAGLPSSPPPAVVLVTDGLVADDAAAIARATAAGVPVHPVGVGSAPNRWLLEAIAAGSGGNAHVSIDPDDAELIAAELIAAADAQPIVVDWRRPAVTDGEPVRAVVVPGGGALVVAIDRTSRGAAAAAAAAGSLGEVEVVVGGQRLRAPIEPVRGSELATEWARLRITRLEASGQGAAATRLALERGLVSSTTALVAVAPSAGRAVQSTVTVPLPLPAGQRPGSLAGASGDVFELEKPTVTLDSDVTPNKEAGDKPADARPAEDDPVGTTAPGTRSADGPRTSPQGGAGRGTATAARPTSPAPTSPPPPPPAPPVDGERSRDADGAAEDDESSLADVEEQAAGAGSTRVAETLPARADADVSYGESMSVAYSRERGRLTLALGLGARLDEPSPAARLSFGLDRRLLRTRFLAGLRLDVVGAPAADRPLSASLLLTFSRPLTRMLALDLGLGPAYDGRLGLGQATGLTVLRGPIGLGLRFSTSVTSGPDPLSLTGGLSLGF